MSAQADSGPWPSALGFNLATFVIISLMDAPLIYRAMARYNRWMNDKLYEVSATLSDEERKRDLKAPFRSLHGTFNHLLLADRIWMGRFTGQPYAAKSLTEELYADFDEMRDARQMQDEEITRWADALTSEQLGGTLHYTSIVNPQPYSLPFWLCAHQLFNHQTHHRGQVTALLEQLGADCGVTDFMLLPGAAELR